MKNIILFTALALMLIVAIGCNTVAGPAPAPQGQLPVGQPQTQPGQPVEFQPQPGPQQPQPGPQQPQPGPQEPPLPQPGPQQPQPGPQEPPLPQPGPQQPQPGPQEPPLPQPGPQQPQPGPQEPPLPQPGPQQPQPGPQQPPPQPTSPPPPTQVPSKPCGGPPVIAFFNANPSTITAGQSSTLSWGAVTNANSAVIDQGIGGVATPGSTTVKPAKTTTYTLTATGCGGTATRQVTVNVSGGAPIIPTVIGKLMTWDLAIDNIYPSSTGKIMVKLKNTGPGTLANDKIKLTCVGQMLYPPPPAGIGMIGKKGFDGTLSLNLSPGATSEYEAGLSREPAIISMWVTCTFTPSFSDTNSSNNSLARQVK